MVREHGSLTKDAETNEAAWEAARGAAVGGIKVRRFGGCTCYSFCVLLFCPSDRLSALWHLTWASLHWHRSYVTAIVLWLRHRLLHFLVLAVDCNTVVSSM